jgi:hypothetical protein
MNRKMITLMISMEHLGEYRVIPDNASPDEKRAIIAHNAQVTIRRALEAEPLVQSARSLSFKVHVGNAGILLRGVLDHLPDIEFPSWVDEKHVREASDRWNPRHN